MVADALAQLDPVGGQPAARLLAPSAVRLEFWYEAASPREAYGGARAALRQAFRAAGVGDPAPPSGRRPVEVMVMLEELPTLEQEGSR